VFLTCTLNRDFNVKTFYLFWLVFVDCVLCPAVKLCALLERTVKLLLHATWRTAKLRSLADHDLFACPGGVPRGWGYWEGGRGLSVRGGYQQSAILRVQKGYSKSEAKTSSYQVGLRSLHDNGN
jgi:hypothetical protein